MSADTVTQAEWDRWGDERVARARADLERTAWQYKQPKGTDHLTERIAELEDRLFVRGVLLASALELLDRRAVELASLRAVIRMDVALKAMERELNEITATPQLAVAA